MQTKNKQILTAILILISTTYFYSQATYDYFSNPDKIGSKSTKSTGYFTKTFGYIALWEK